MVMTSAPSWVTTAEYFEDELGTALFERTPRGMLLLPEGEVFLCHARGILANLAAAVAAVAALADQRRPEAKAQPHSPRPGLRQNKKV